jgi:hypothetical protein
MSHTSARRSVPPEQLASPSAPQFVNLLAACNPTASRAQLQTVGKFVAQFAAIVMELSPEYQMLLRGKKAALQKLMQRLVADASAPLLWPPDAVAETIQGAGGGEMLTEEEARARLDAYATHQPTEDWAGKLAGPAELQRDYGIARSTLRNWQQQGYAIAIQVNAHKRAFPVEQFVDGRPVAGLAEVVRIIGDTRIAWRWLREPNPLLSGARPLSRLKKGAFDLVLQIARSNYDL